MQQSTNNKGNKKTKFPANKNVLETLTNLGSQAVDTIKNEAKLTSEEFFNQLLGQQKLMNEKRQGNLDQGGPVSMDRILTGDEAREQKLKKQINFEQRILQEERQETGKKLQELRMKLQVIQAEAVKMIHSTQKLTEEVKLSVLQNPVGASEYQINFFESIINLIVSFRKKIDSTINWLQGSNSRAQKKNYWSMYKKKGASFLLSGESYSQRSAG